ncbi:peptidase domain-containing ABC transporter [Corallococcus sp. ZKHCc1 1396]|uniref:Peptidase domain-containing ABC transporter n=1 Tax=Corallococcus soli TaxID=2710757 RepID=A0ABR9PNI7_9BACT|nr:peptidase domain-containing ABC transporter [Corallococcus soli]MBE4749490.1 peptidase domain-containing ABC transporter [Corallococcus soli]
MAPESKPSLQSRFPALRRLSARVGRHRIPEFRQMALTDCGAACLAMVLGYHGRHVTLQEVRESAGVARDGLTALTLLNAARRLGLRGRGASLDVDQLHFLPTATILHWRFTHFVVFERAEKDWVEIIDPAQGRRRVSMEVFRQSFTGVVLLLEPAEGFERGRSETPGLGRYIVPLFRQSGTLGRIFSLSLMLQLFTLAIPILTGVVVDRVIPRTDHSLLFVMGAGLLGLIVFQFLTSLVRGYLLTELRTRVDSELTLGTLEHLVSLSFPFFQLRPVGDLMMRLNMNAMVRDILSTGTLSTMLDGLLVLIYMAILLVASPLLCLLVLGLGALQLLVFALSQRKQRSLLSQNLEQDSRNQSYQLEMLAGMQTLKAFGVEARSVQLYSNLFVDSLNLSVKRGVLSTWVESFTSTLRLASPLLLLLLGAWRVMEGELTTGQMLGVNALASAVLVPLANLVSTAGQFLLLRTYLERLNDVMDAPPERSRDRVGRSLQLTGACELDHVSFRYDKSGPLVVQDVSVRILPGQMVAIVGRSGAGKSTLANLLLSLYLPTSGRIVMDGADLNDLDLQSVRSQMGVVLQEPSFFGTTVRANIALNDTDIPLDAVMSAAQQAQIHDDIMAMPLKYDTPLSSFGQGLSGGQRQRLGLARALVRKPAMLLLDEATSALDALTEARVHDALAALRCTRVVIAHRMSTVVNANLILVMEAGRLVEQGSHRELMARGGIYASLIHAQLRGHLPPDEEPLPMRVSGT